MNLSLVLHTVRHLRLRQVVYQMLYHIRKPRYRSLNAQLHRNLSGVTFEGWIAKQKCYNAENDIFAFLNQAAVFSGWNDASRGMLWAYNLNYMDWLCQGGIDYGTGAYWINKFIDELPANNVALDSYPIALRGINWIKFITGHIKDIDKTTLHKWDESLYSQYALLSRKLEYHLMGNHLLEDAFSLFISSIYFSDKKFYKKASRLLVNELNGQILSDGAHFEQSPMYHCILLDRLLDCINFSQNNLRFENQVAITESLKGKAICMLGHLESIVYENGDIPLLNDSAYGIAPTSGELFAYAKRLGLEWKLIPLKECGYRKLENKSMEAVVDVGDITATYQPGHSHADTFNYELRIDGSPFIVDTGISTYNKNTRRQYERSTAAHNCVTVNGKNSSEVWSGFRVGNRAEVSIDEDNEKEVVATHNGYTPVAYRRKFRIEDSAFIVSDELSDNAKGIGYIHLARGIEILQHSQMEIKTSVADILICDCDRIEIKNEYIATEYNNLLATHVVELHFNGAMEYRIGKNGI